MVHQILPHRGVLKSLLAEGGERFSLIERGARLFRLQLTSRETTDLGVRFGYEPLERRTMSRSDVGSS